VEPIAVFFVIGLAGVAIAAIVTIGIRSTVIAATRHRAQAGDAERAGDALVALEERVDQLQRQVGELAERQDFAERLLAQARERGLLTAPPPKG
jgi:hypothetical protein